jgi:glycosidase
MQWTDGKNAGFSKAKQPWLPIAKGYEKSNVKSESKDPGSYFTLYKKLAQMRNNSEALRYGEFKLIKTGNSSVLAFSRLKNKTGHLVLVNFSEEIGEAKIPKSIKIGEFQISSDATTLHKDTKNNTIHLLPNEAAVFSN